MVKIQCIARVLLMVSLSLNFNTQQGNRNLNCFKELIFFLFEKKINIPSFLPDIV